MSEKKGGTAKLLGCVGCLGVLLIGGLGVGLVGALGGGAFLMYGTNSGPSPYEFQPGDFPIVEPTLVAPDPEPVAETEADPDTEPDSDTEADSDSDSDSGADEDTEPQAETDATVPEPSPGPTPEPAVTVPSPSPVTRPEPVTRPDPRPEPAPLVAPPAEPAPSSDSYISLDGEGVVVLVGGGRRYTIPGNVPAGRYDIEVTFPGQDAVSVDRITVREGSNATIRCNARMGVCRPR